MAATAVDAAIGTGAGTRRAVVRSERFMEWQREISRSVPAVRRPGHTGALGTAERHSSDDENAKALGQEGSEGRDVEAGGAAGESQGGADVAGAKEGGENLKGKKTQQQQRQRSDAKKGGKEEEGEEKKSVASSGKDGAPRREGEGGRMRRCKQQANPGSAVRRAAGPAATPQQLAQPLARRRQRRLPRPLTPPKEDVERGLRSLTRNRGSEGTAVATRVAPTNSSKGATKRSKRVAQRVANEEPAPPPLKLPKLHLVLTRKEIQEDWLNMTGHKYSGKPRKSTLVGRGLGLCTALTCPSSIRYLNEPQCRCGCFASGDGGGHGGSEARGCGGSDAWVAQPGWFMAESDVLSGVRECRTSCKRRGLSVENPAMIGVERWRVRQRPFWDSPEASRGTAGWSGARSCTAQRAARGEQIGQGCIL